MSQDMDKIIQDSMQDAVSAKATGRQQGVTVQGVPFKQGIYYTQMTFGKLRVTEADIQKSINNALAKSKHTNNGTSYGLFVMPDGLGGEKAVMGPEFEKEFPTLWANRSTNGLAFKKGSVNIKGSDPTNIHTIQYYVWLENDVPLPDGLSGRVDAVLDTKGKVLYFIDENGNRSNSSNGISGLGALPAVVTGVLWFLSIVVAAIAAYFGYLILDRILIRPIARGIKAAGRFLEQIAPYLSAGLILWGGSKLIAASNSGRGRS
jgi:hypothetical protein